MHKILFYNKFIIRLIGAPTSEVGYTLAMPMREDHEVHKRTCGGSGKKKLYASTCFEHYVLVIRRLKFYYTAPGIIKLVGGSPVHRLREDSSLNLCTGRPPV